MDRNVEEFVAWLKKKNPQGISYDLAVQLCLWLFCTKAILPHELDYLVLNRETLTDTFSALSRDNVITAIPRAHRSQVSSSDHWISCIDSFMAGEMDLNRNIDAELGNLLNGECTGS